MISILIIYLLWYFLHPENYRDFREAKIGLKFYRIKLRSFKFFPTAEHPIVGITA